MGLGLRGALANPGCPPALHARRPHTYQSRAGCLWAPSSPPRPPLVPVSGHWSPASWGSQPPSPLTFFESSPRVAPGTREPSDRDQHRPALPTAPLPLLVSQPPDPGSPDPHHPSPCPSSVLVLSFPCTPPLIPVAPSALLPTLPRPGPWWPVPRYLRCGKNNGESQASGWGPSPDHQPAGVGGLASVGLEAPSLTLPAGPCGDRGTCQASALEGGVGVWEPSGMECSLPVGVEAFLCSDLQSYLHPSGGCCSRTGGVELLDLQGPLRCWGGDRGLGSAVSLWPGGSWGPIPSAGGAGEPGHHPQSEGAPAEGF